VRQLKAQVERVVHPVRASVGRKMKMREELLGHLTTSYEEGLANGLKEEEAIRRALERFGEPAVLRAELQASVPVVEGILYFAIPFHSRITEAGRTLWKGDDESALRHAWRLCGSVLAACLPYLLGAYALLFGYLAATGTARSSLSECWRFVTAFHGASLVCFFLYIVFLDEVQQALQTAGSSLHRAARIGAWCVPAIAMVLGSGMGVWIIVGKPSPHVTWQLLVAVSVLVPGMLVCPAIALTADRKRREEWESLILDG